MNCTLPYKPHTQKHCGAIRKSMQREIPTIQLVFDAPKRPGKSDAYSTPLRTGTTEIGPQLPTFDFPRRLFRWVYSVSLFILVTLMLALVSATPIDVIVQTSTASFRGIKLFIVIIVCVVFLTTGFILYFSRIYQHRVSMNDIPNHTVYSLQSNDLPKTAYKFIESKLQQCQEIQKKADPLTNSKTINYPGISPPEYIQQRNTGHEGHLLPPNLHYDDVIRSFSDKFNLWDNFSSVINPPTDATFKDIVSGMIQDLLDARKITPTQAPNLGVFLSLYEKFRFGHSLIKEHEMVDFLIECSKFSNCVLTHYGTVFAVRRKKYQDDYSNSYLGSYSNIRSDFYSVPSEFSNISSPYIPEPYSGSEESVLKDKRLRRRRRRTSSASGTSVVKQRLSIGGEPRRPSTVMFDLADTSRRYSRSSPYKSLQSGSNGGSSEDEQEPEYQKEEEEEEEEDDDDVYNFRKSTNKPITPILKETPILKVEAPESEQNSPIRSRSGSPQKLLDLEIKRSKSPKRKNFSKSSLSLTEPRLKRDKS